MYEFFVCIINILSVCFRLSLIYFIPPVLLVIVSVASSCVTPPSLKLYFCFSSLLHPITRQSVLLSFLANHCLPSHYIHLFIHLYLTVLSFSPFTHTLLRLPFLTLHLSSSTSSSPFLFLSSFRLYPPLFYLLTLPLLLHLQLQKAIEGSTRSGVRLRPPLASFRDISNHNSVAKPPASSPAAPSSPTSTSSPSAATPPPRPSPSPLHHHHHHHHYQENETEVWIEGVKIEVEESSSSSIGSGGGSSSMGASTSASRSCSYNSNLTLPPSSTPPPVPSSSTPPLSSDTHLSTQRPLQGVLEGDEDSDDEPMV